MAKCSRCGKCKSTPYYFEGRDPLCEECAEKGELQSCPDCGYFYKLEDMEAGRCRGCAAKSDD